MATMAVFLLSVDGFSKRPVGGIQFWTPELGKV